MANITLSDLTPIHFLESVKLLKENEYRVLLSYDSVEIRFAFDRAETFEETQSRLEQMEHLQQFLRELVHSNVPIDREDFLRQFNPMYRNQNQRFRRK